MRPNTLRVPLLLALLLAVLVWLATSEQQSTQPTIGSRRAIALRHRRRLQNTRPASTPVPTRPSSPVPPLSPHQIAEEPASGEEKAGSLQSPLRAIREGLGQEVAAGTITPPPKILRYSDKLFLRYDADANHELKFEEWSLMHGTPELADSNHDGRITPAELLERIAAYGLPRAMRLKPLLPADENASPDLVAAGDAPAGNSTVEENAAAPPTTARTPVRPFFVDPSRLPAGLNHWFVDNDADGDGQISLAEFSATLSEAEVARFRARDSDGDGLITPQEFLHGDQPTAAEKPAARANSPAAATTDSASAADQPTAPSGSGGDLP